MALTINHTQLSNNRIQKFISAKNKEEATELGWFDSKFEDIRELWYGESKEKALGKAYDQFQSTLERIKPQDTNRYITVSKDPEETVTKFAALALASDTPEKFHVKIINANDNYPIQPIYSFYIDNKPIKTVHLQNLPSPKTTMGVTDFERNHANKKHVMQQKEDYQKALKRTFTCDNTLTNDQTWKLKLLENKNKESSRYLVNTHPVRKTSAAKFKGDETFPDGDDYSANTTTFFENILGEMDM